MNINRIAASRNGIDGRDHISAPDWKRQMVLIAELPGEDLYLEFGASCCKKRPKRKNQSSVIGSRKNRFRTTLDANLSYGIDEWWAATFHSANSKSVYFVSNLKVHMNSTQTKNDMCEVSVLSAFGSLNPTSDAQPRRSAVRNESSLSGDFNIHIAEERVRNKHNHPVQRFAVFTDAF
jgi:hypothetical protein